MMQKTDNMYFVIPEGATQEQRWSWGEIEELCRQGQISPDARVFMPESNSWVRAADTDLGELFDDDVLAGAEDPESNTLDKIETDYADALGRIQDNPGDIEALVAAGKLAADAPATADAARVHFQVALDLKPFNTRIAREVRRSFPQTEWESFRYLERLRTAWDDPADLVKFPLASGLVYAGVAALSLALCVGVPTLRFVLLPAWFVWLVQVVRAASEGAGAPPLWQRALGNPMNEMVKPALAGLIIATLWGGALLVVALIRLMINPEADISVFAYLTRSPLITVFATVVLVAYLPAMILGISVSFSQFARMLLPWKAARAVMATEQEYPQTVAVIFAMVFVWGGVYLVMGSVPVLGALLGGASGAYLLLVAGFMLGRLLNRVRHTMWS